MSPSLHFPPPPSLKWKLSKQMVLLQINATGWSSPNWKVIEKLDLTYEKVKQDLWATRNCSSPWANHSYGRVSHSQPGHCPSLCELKCERGWARRTCRTGAFPTRQPDFNCGKFFRTRLSEGTMAWCHAPKWVLKLRLDKLGGKFDHH